MSTGSDWGDMSAMYAAQRADAEQDEHEDCAEQLSAALSSLEALQQEHTLAQEPIWVEAPTQRRFNWRRLRFQSWQLSYEITGHVLTRVHGRWLP